MRTLVRDTGHVLGWLRFGLTALAVELTAPARSALGWARHVYAIANAGVIR